MAASDLDKAIEADDLDLVKRLVGLGADLTAMGDYDSTPLSNAAALGRSRIVAYLLEAGADPSLGGCTPPLYIASGRGYHDVCRMLLAAGADPNHKDLEGYSPAEVATFKGHVDILKTLVEAGARIDVEALLLMASDENSTAGSHDETIEYLLSLREITNGQT